MSALKMCHKCKVEKPLSAFARCEAKPDGLQVECRKCKRDAYFARKSKRTQERIAAEILTPKKAYKPFTPDDEEVDPPSAPYTPYSETDEAKRKRAEGQARLRKHHVVK